MTTDFATRKIAVVLPCYNEGQAIDAVIKSFKNALPSAEVFVFDNNSSDNTVEVARNAGAHVIQERFQGKGNVVRRIFAEVDADCYLMADGDGTYDAKAAPDMVRALFDGHLDMVVGCRQSVEGEKTYRAGHAFGNKLLTGLAQNIFGQGFSDMLTGYRAFSRRFAKSFPVLSAGFEIETEITVHCLSLKLPACEIQTNYYERAEGTESKLSTYRDGWRILMMIMRLFKEIKPLLFFGIVSAVLAVLSIALAIPLIIEFRETGLVPRYPTAVLCTGMMITAFLTSACGIILDSLARKSLEAKKMAYLAQSPGIFPHV